MNIPELEKLPDLWHKNTKDLISNYRKGIEDSLSYYEKNKINRQSWHNDMKESIGIINQLINIATHDNRIENDEHGPVIQSLHEISERLPGGKRSEDQSDLLWASLALTICLIGMACVIPSLAFASFFGVLAALSALLFFVTLLGVPFGYSRSLYLIAKDLTEEFSFRRNLLKIQNNSNMHDFIETLQDSSDLQVTESALWLERATYKHNNQTHVLGLIRTFFNPKRLVETPNTTQKRKIVDEAFHKIQACGT